jgi:hypothetical protein
MELNQLDSPTLKSCLHKAYRLLALRLNASSLIAESAKCTSMNILHVHGEVSIFPSREDVVVYKVLDTCYFC